MGARDRARRDQHVLEHERGRPGATQHARHDSRNGCAERGEAGPQHRLQRPPPRHAVPVLGYVKPIRTDGAHRATTIRLGTWNDETTVRRSSPKRRSASASSSRRVVSLRSTWSPTSGASSTKNSSASSSVGSSGATARSSANDRCRTDPSAAPWLTSSRRSECASTSGPRGRSRTSNSTRSTPCATASRNEWSVFSGARCAAPRCPILSTAPSRRRRSITLLSDGAKPPPGDQREDHGLGDRDRGRELGDVLPEPLRVEPDERVRAREAPGVSLEEHLVEAREEAVEAEQDEGHGENRDRERGQGAGEQAPGTTTRRRVRPSTSARTTTTSTVTSCARRAAPNRVRTSSMCASSRASNACVPSGNVARSSRTIPSDPGWMESRPVRASASRWSRVSP